MRRTLPLALLAAIAAIGISACSNSSNAAANATDQNAATSSAAADNTATDNTATGNAAASDNSAASTAPADAGAAAAPVYPGAAMEPRPKGVADGAPSTVKAYLTPDGMVTVRTWYKAHLKGASEMGAPDNDKNKDVFLVGQGATGQVVMLQSVGGKTWVIIGPPK